MNRLQQPNFETRCFGRGRVALLVARLWRDTHLAATGLLWAFLLLSCGCSRWMPEVIPFGSVGPPDYNRSLSGLGLHREIWETAGAKSIIAKKLSPRLDSVEVIVLVGQTFAPPGEQARAWLEDWLAAETGRSVIYFGRDLNGEVYYRQRTLSQLDSSRSKIAEQDLARAQVRELRDRVREVPESTFCRWFYLDVQHGRTTYTQFDGPWAGDLQGLAGQWPVGIALQTPQAQDWQNLKPSWLTTPKAATSTPVFDPFASEDGTVRRSRWQLDELETDTLWDAEFQDVPVAQTLLTAADGVPLVTRLTSDKFSGSQIIVVANAAPFLNATLIEPLHRGVAEKLVDMCLPAEKVALLAYDSNGILISSIPESDARGAGLEMFLVWPLYALTIPLALIGIVLCMAVAPILGRPKSLPKRSVSDFGLHVDAVGKLLRETQDLAYATSIIEVYFRRVRGEPPPEWLAQQAAVASPEPRMPTGPAPQTPGTPPAATQTPGAQSPAPESAAPESPGLPAASQAAVGVPPPQVSDPGAGERLLAPGHASGEKSATPENDTQAGPPSQ